jgi:hypothetical protein
MSTARTDDAGKPSGVTADETAAILGPEVCALVDAFVATAPPLSEAQKTLLRRLFATDTDDRQYPLGSHRSC